MEGNCRFKINSVVRSFRFEAEVFDILVIVLNGSNYQLGLCVAAPDPNRSVQLGGIVLPYPAGVPRFAMSLSGGMGT